MPAQNRPCGVALPVVEAKVGAVRLDVGQALDRAVVGDRPEPVGERRDPAATGARGDRADRRRQLDRPGLAVARGQVEPALEDVDPGDPADPGVPDRPLAEERAEVDDQLGRRAVGHRPIIGGSTGVGRGSPRTPASRLAAAICGHPTAGRPGRRGDVGHDDAVVEAEQAGRRAGSARDRSRRVRRPRSRPSRRASASAAPSTIGPRAVFTRIAVGFIRASAVASISPRVSGVSGTWRLTMSLRARSSSSPTPGRPERGLDDLGCPRPPVVEDGHPEAGGPPSDRLADPPEPHDPEGRAVDVGPEQEHRTPRRPAAGPDEAVALGDPPRGGKDERERQVRGRLGQDPGRVADRDAATGAGGDVDVVVPDGEVADTTRRPGPAASSSSSSTRSVSRLRIPAQPVTRRRSSARGGGPSSVQTSASQAARIGARPSSGMTRATKTLGRREVSMLGQRSRPAGGRPGGSAARPGGPSRRASP